LRRRPAVRARGEHGQVPGRRGRLGGRQRLPRLPRRLRVRRGVRRGAEVPGSAALQDGAHQPESGAGLRRRARPRPSPVLLMKLAERVAICEVGTRDGFQIEPGFIPTELKIEMVDRLADAGLPQIEVTSFVHPKVVPQMRDAEAVMAGIRRRPGTTYSALVPNDQGAVRALDAGADELRTVISASESHNLANVNMTVEESLGRLRAVAEVAVRAGKPVVAGISTSFGCPFEGAVPLDRIEWLCGRLADLGV